MIQRAMRREPSRATRAGRRVARNRRASALGLLLALALPAAGLMVTSVPALAASTVFLGTGNFPEALNSYGQVLVQSVSPSGTTTLFTPSQQNGTAFTQTTIGSSGATYGYAINAGGAVVGDFQVAASGNCPAGPNLPNLPVDHAFIWTPGASNSSTGAFADASALLPGAYSSGFTGINASGQIVGSYLDFSCTTHAFLLTPGQGGMTFTDLAEGVTPDAINDFGQVVVSPGSGTPPSLGTPVSANNPTTGSFTNLYNLGLNQVVTPGPVLSPTGRVVGRDSSGNAGLWSPSTDNGATGPTTRDIGTLSAPGAFGEAINTGCEVVGSAQTSGGDAHAFVWGLQSGMADLNSLVSVGTGTLNGGRGVNDAGEIVAVDTSTPPGGGQLFNAVLITGITPGVGCPPADTTPPVMSLPSPITADPGSTGSAVVSWSATATDDDGTTPVVSCSPASGSTFYVGTTTVYCQATDNAGNTADGHFTVTVVDAGAPTLQLPGNMVVNGTSPSGGVVSFSATATDTDDGANPAVNCSPANGTTFAYGTTTVNCSSTDRYGNTSTGSFSVTVLTPAQQVTNTINTVNSYNLGGYGNTLVSILQTVQKQIAGGHIQGACGNLAYFVSQVQSQSGKKLTVTQANTLLTDATTIESALGC